MRGGAAILSLPLVSLDLWVQQPLLRFFSRRAASEPPSAGGLRNGMASIFHIRATAPPPNHPGSIGTDRLFDIDAAIEIAARCSLVRTKPGPTAETCSGATEGSCQTWMEKSAPLPGGIVLVPILAVLSAAYPGMITRRIRVHAKSSHPSLLARSFPSLRPRSVKIRRRPIPSRL